MEPETTTNVENGDKAEVAQEPVSESETDSYREPDYSKIMANKLRKLKDSDDPEAIRTLLKYLCYHNDVYEAAEEILNQKIRKKHADILIEYLNSDRKKCWYGIHVAMELLGKIRSVKAIPTMAKYLHNRTQMVRMAVANELGYIGSKKGIPILLEALDDCSSSVVEWACNSLVKIGDTSVIGILQDKLENAKNLWDRDRVYISCALYMFGDTDKLQNILMYLKKDKRKYSYLVREAAAGELVYIADCEDNETRQFFIDELRKQLAIETNDDAKIQMQHSIRYIEKLIRGEIEE